MRWWVVLPLLLIFPLQVSASRSITIGITQSLVEGDGVVPITASLSGFLSGEVIKIKGAFFKEGSTNYFGLTKYGDSWIKNSSNTVNQKEVSVGVWDGVLEVKPDQSDSGFVGSGSYLFKVGFYYYTNGDKLSSVNWSDNILAINITQAQAPTPTSIPLPTDSPVPSKTPFPSPRPSSTPTLKPSFAPSASPIPPSVTSVATVTPTGLAILPTVPGPSDTPVATPEVLGLDSTSGENRIPSLLLVIAGIVCLGTSFVLVLRTPKL